MCGRFQLALTWTQLVELYGLASSGADPGWAPSWSVCPTHRVPVIRGVGAAREGRLARWGFPMPWLARQGKDPWSRALINARGEEAASKRTWAGPLRRGRRIVPATAYVEWSRRGGRKLPVSIHHARGEPLHLAAIASTFEREGVSVEAVSLLTTAAHPSVERIHDRMPVIVPSEQLDAWLGEGPVPAFERWSPPPLSLAPLPTSMNKAGHLAEPPGPADWDLGT
ncbi:MAG: SOS response-associated peptidase [Deltaproteobacteria bacterium]|nr:MAG: SOS response-associated peptidase [Deltaproteobacteria bacterium]